LCTGAVLPSALLCTATSPRPFYPLSLHDALPICSAARYPRTVADQRVTLIHHAERDEYDATVVITLRVMILLGAFSADAPELGTDRKSTRLNSSHQIISYAVFFLKKKKHLQHAEG